MGDTTSCVRMKKKREVVKWDNGEPMFIDMAVAASLIVHTEGVYDLPELIDYYDEMFRVDLHIAYKVNYR